MKNYLIYPCKTMNITQGYSGSYSHSSHINGTPKDYPIDEAGASSSREYFYCPCDEIQIAYIYGVGKSGTNTIWLESTSKVDMPYGTDYVTILVTHPNDDDLSKLKVGQKFTRGQEMFREGTDGNATGNHFHIAVGTGKYGDGWVQNTSGAWVMKTTGTQLKPEQAFYIDTSFTDVKSSNNITFKKIGDDTMAFLTPDKTRTEHGLVIKEKLIPDGTKKPNGGNLKAGKLLSSGTGKVQYITIHNTDDIDEAPGTNDAEQYARSTWNGNMGDVVVHYYIDETDCWQLLREDEVSYHAGDGPNGVGNTTSLSVEIIMDGSGSAADKEAEDRGALLAAILLNRHGLSIDKLVQHKKWNGKDCPTYIIPHWKSFVAKVEENLYKIKNVGVKKTIFRVQTGAFASKYNAQQLSNELKNKGFDNFIAYVAPYYKVQVGAYSVRANAEKQMKDLKDAGYNCFITSVSV